MSRDPLVHPLPGDRIRRGNVTIRIDYVVGGRVWASRGGRNVAAGITLDEYREQVKGATVAGRDEQAYPAWGLRRAVAA